MTDRMKSKGWTLQNISTLVGLIIILFGGVYSYAESKNEQKNILKEIAEQKDINEKLLQLIMDLDKRVDLEEKDSILKTEILKNLSTDIGEIKDLFRELLNKG